MGESSDIEYNIGVCCYKSKMLTASCVCFQNILERAVKEHPELMVSQKVDGLKTQSFANSQALLYIKFNIVRVA
jgi:tetratricopeptide repeat protein 30